MFFKVRADAQQSGSLDTSSLLTYLFPARYESMLAGDLAVHAGPTKQARNSPEIFSANLLTCVTLRATLDE